MGDNLLPDDLLCIIEETESLPEAAKQILNDYYSRAENKVKYIFYTGINCNKDYKHSIEQFVHAVEPLIGDGYKWYELVVLAGASVYWK
jgi:hypothetical protein